MTSGGSLTLRAYHDSETAEAVSIAFGRPATTVFVKGQPSQIQGLVIDRHAWLLNASALVTEDGFERQTGALIAFLAARAGELRTLRARAWSFDVVADWASPGFGGPRFDSKHLRVLGELGLDLWIRFVNRPKSSEIGHA